MAEPVIPVKAKLFIGILYSSEAEMAEAEKYLLKKYGAIDFRTDGIPFSHTMYYQNIGASLKKVFFSFEKLIKRESIVDIKLHTNKLEKKVSSLEKRSINIDPGYLTLSNVYLASCKEFFHRAYLDKGIYLENEYKYVGRKFQFWEWTYPDYKKLEYLDFFYKARNIYYKQLKAKNFL